MRGRLGSALLPTLKGYQRSWLGADLLAGMALLAIAVPEQLATSRLAGMPPITGFYAFVAGTALFALFGSNPQMSVGADSTIAPLFAVGVAHLAASGSSHYLQLVGVLAVMIGVIVGLVGLLRLGWIAEFLSAPIITGFLAGVGVIIIVHQLPDVLGLAGPSGSTVHRLRVLASQLGSVNGWSLGIGLSVLVVVVVAERVDKRIPGAIAGMVGAIAVVAGLGLRSHGVHVLGAVAHEVPHFGLAGLSLSNVRSLGPVALVVALVVISQSAATTRAFADQGGFDVDVSRDFIGVGLGSVAAGLAGSFPVNASPARTAAVAASGGRTQVAGLAAAGALVALVPAAGVLKDVPDAALGAVLFVVAGRLFHLRDLRAIARFDRFELGLALVTLITVALVGVEQGIAVAVTLAVLDRTRLSARPQLHVLGRIPGTTSWIPITQPGGAVEIPGYLVVLFSTPLWYANAGHFRAAMTGVLHTAAIHPGAATDAPGSPPPAEGKLPGPHDRNAPRVVVLDAIGMSDMDYTGARALGAVIDQLAKVNVVLAVARAGAHLRQNLEHSGLAARIGADNFFPSVDAAVTRRVGPHPV